jgi:CheY-like chemotaxis protein
VSERQLTILVVEDNPITRKMFRVTLETAGYAVREAGDGREALELAGSDPPALIVQDVRLPGMSGFDLAERLRALPQCADVPIIAMSGMLTRDEEKRIAAVLFHEFLAKPVAPSLLLEAIRAHLPAAPDGSGSTGSRGHILVADDEPIQRKLTVRRLTDAGYVVETAVDGEDALARARHDPPDAILSDVLMPKLDGYGLCRAVRQDPRLAHLPVVLASSAYVEQEDRDLAVKMGADALVTRTPDLGAVIAALETSRSPERVAPRVIVHEFTTTAHLHRVVHQLERQLAMTATLAQRNAALAAQLAAIDGISRVLVATTNPDQAAEEVLARCLEAGGVSEGALYLRRPNGALSLRASIGFAGVRRALLEMFFGHPDLLDQVITAHTTLALPSPAIPEAADREILERSGVAGLVIATIPGDSKPAGALVMGSQGAGLDTEEWLTFARVVGTQLGYAVALTRLAGRAEPLPERQIRRKPPGHGRAAHPPRLAG